MIGNLLTLGSAAALFTLGALILQNFLTTKLRPSPIRVRPELRRD